MADWHEGEARRLAAGAAQLADGLARACPGTEAATAAAGAATALLRAAEDLARAAAEEAAATLRAADLAAGTDAGAAAAADTALRAALSALADEDPGPGAAGWRARLRLALAGGNETMPPGAAVRAQLARRAGAALGELRAAGPAGAATLGLLGRAGLLGPYLALLGPAEAARAVPAAAAPGAAGWAAAVTAVAGLDPRGAAAPEAWEALLGAAPGGRAWLDGDEWLRLCACTLAGGEGRARTLLADTRPGPGGSSRLLEAAALTCPRAWRAATLATHERAGSSGGGAARALAAGLGARDLRGLALRGAAERPDMAPLGACPRSWGALDRASRSSRLRAAMWLASRPRPAGLAALELAGTRDPGALPALRRLATGDGHGRREAGWRLAALGTGADAPAVAAALAGGRADWGDVRRAAEVLAGRPGGEAALAAAGAALGAVAATPGCGRDLALGALRELGAARPGEGARVAAGLLGSGGAAGLEAARWLVARAPEVASPGALGRAGLLPDPPGHAARHLRVAWAETLDR